MNNNPIYQASPLLWTIGFVLVIAVLIGRAYWMHHVQRRPEEVQSELDDLKKTVRSQQMEIDRLRRDVDDLKRNRTP